MDGIPRHSVVVVALVASLLAYAVAAATRHWWPSLITAPIVAVLLWRRHRRARFTAYVFFTVLAIRGTLTGIWLLPVYALAALGVMQTGPARQAWPRLVPRWPRRGGDRMRRS
jgi:hypothetical protein